MQRPTTKPTPLEARLEGLVRNGLAWLTEWVLSFIRIGLFILSIPRRVLPTILHVAAFTTILPALLAISVGAGITVVNLIPEGWNTDLWMQYGEQATPFARTSLPPLTPGQPYDITLALQVPITAENLALGNFMTRLILTDAKNVTVATANRPQSLVLSKQSSWIPFLRTPPTETIVVPLVEHWSPSSQPGNLLNHGVAVARGTSHQGFHAFIAVGRSDAWKSLGGGQGKELSIAKATLYGHVKLSGIRGFFARHKFLLFVLTTAVFFAASTGAALIFYLLLAPNLSSDHTEVDGTTLIQEQGTQTTPRMRFKEDDTEPPSTSETEYSWASGGPGGRIKAESDEDDSSTDT
ncbi:unnamed protein product [Rhizoctonia solani]|uniref:Adipose-regulatory protein-domain-containing protein n=1 Tax=Rhizoctonia solani TaxID=456999 RepID=A0A8H3HKG6_9AGAM|nr:unnamed protein product [Rhizoctonia solani]